MDMTNQFYEDFDFMLADWGESIKINILNSETIDTYTGNILKNETEITQSAIVERIKEKTLELYPNIYTSLDRIMYVKNSYIKKGDQVILGLDEKIFLVHELENIREIKRIFLKRVQ